MIYGVTRAPPVELRTSFFKVIFSLLYIATWPPFFVVFFPEYFTYPIFRFYVYSKKQKKQTNLKLIIRQVVVVCV